MKRKLPKSIFDAEWPSLWRHGRRFFAQPARVSSTRKAGRHFSGGPSPHKGSQCPQCKKRLSLLWDLDLSDPLIPVIVRDGFAPSTRLPFYICWQCVAASYSLSSNTSMQTFVFDQHNEALKADETPFGEAPVELARRPKALTRIPTTIDALLSLADEIGIDECDKSGRQTLSEFLNHKVESDWDLPISQLGGMPLPNQGHSDRVCPNAKCPASTLEHPYGELVRPYLMKELALIHWRDEPILASACFQLLYLVCGICFSIRAEYHCS
jgi:hypothetical protein